MNNIRKGKAPIYIGISVIALLIPGLLLCFILSASCTSAFFAAWVYQDCKRRGEDPVLWAVVVFAVTPFIGLLIYFLRRSEIKMICPACGLSVQHFPAAPAHAEGE